MQPAHSAQEPTVSLLDLLGQSHLSTLLAHLVVDKTRLHSSSPAALNPDHCHYHKELLIVNKPTKKTTRKAGQCGLQLTCVVGRTAAPRLRLDRLLCSGGPTCQGALCTPPAKVVSCAFRQPEMGALAPVLAGVKPKKGQKGCLLGNRPSSTIIVRGITFPNQVLGLIKDLGKAKLTLILNCEDNIPRSLSRL